MIDCTFFVPKLNWILDVSSYTYDIIEAYGFSMHNFSLYDRENTFYRNDDKIVV